MSNGEILIALLVVGLVCTFIMKKVAVSIYQKTGVNTLKGMHKVLWYVQAIAILFAFGIQSLPLIIAALAVGLILHTLLSLKAGILNAVIMGVLQTVGGVTFSLLYICVLLLNLVAMVTGNGGSASSSKLRNAFSIDETQANAAEKAKADKNEQAETYASKLGFSSADEAEDAGIDTGKNHQ